MGIFGFKGKKDKVDFVPAPVEPAVQKQQTTTSKGKEKHSDSKKPTAVVGTISLESPATTIVPHTKGDVIKSGQITTYGASFPKQENGVQSGSGAVTTPASEIHPLYDSETEVASPSYTGTFFNRTKKSPYVYKRLVEKKLSIILIEDTTLVSQEKEKLVQIIKGLVTEGKACIITYGEDVKQSEVFDVLPNGGIPFPVNENIGDTACLYDALIETSKLVFGKHNKTEETDTQRVMISDIDIIGIGTCKDNGSKVAKETALNVFYKVVSKHRVMTKYFCLTEESFMDAAEVGFRSIGAIFRNYQ